jgi:hypothetical protein
VWHVDDSILNNDDENHPKVALMESDGLNNLKIRGGPSNQGDPYPGSTNNQTFNAGSNPNSNTYTTYPSAVAITNITNLDSSIKMDISVVVPGWGGYVLAAGPSLSQGCNIASTHHVPDSMDVFWISRRGTLQYAAWGGSQWQLTELTTPGSALPTGGSIAAVSKDSTHMCIFWTYFGGAIWSSWWWSSTGWTTFTLAPAGSIAPGSRIAVTSRSPTAMEIFWAGPDGSVRHAWWSNGSPDEWQTAVLAPAGSVKVDPGGAGVGAVAALSRTPSVTEVWWVRPDLNIGNAWYSDSAGWNLTTTPTNKPADLKTDITAVSRAANHAEIMWISSDGSVQGALPFTPPRHFRAMN